MSSATEKKQSRMVQSALGIPISALVLIGMIVSICLGHLPASIAAESCGDPGAGGENYACTNLDICGTAPTNTPCTGTLCTGDPKDITQWPANNQGLVSVQGAGPTCLKKEPCVKYRQGTAHPAFAVRAQEIRFPPSATRATRV
jgi:hypothetical protein